MMAMRILETSRMIDLWCQIKHVYQGLGRPSEGWIAVLKMMSSLWDKPAMVKTVKVSWLVPSKRPCPKKSASLPGKKRRAPHENIDFERAGCRYLIGHRIGRAGAGRRRRQILVQQMPGLPRDRRRRQEQGRPRAERARRPPLPLRGGLLLLRRQQEFRHHLGQGCIPRIHQGAEGEDSRHQDGVRRHQERERGQRSLGLRLLV